MACACSSAERTKIQLNNIIKHNEETYSFDFQSPTLSEWSEGDSSKVYLDVLGKEVGKKFSYATLPEEGIVRFTTRIRRDRSAYKSSLFALKPGDHVEVTMPSGEFKLQRINKPIVILSNGVGIATARSLIKAYEVDQDNIPMMLQINVDSSGRIYHDELSELEKDIKGFTSLYTTHRSEFYNELDHKLQAILLEDADPLIYIVGGDGFVSGTLSYLKDVGFEDDSLKTDGHVGETCGCETDGGCGCGSNIVTQIIPINEIDAIDIKAS